MSNFEDFDGEALLLRLQAEAGPTGFHKKYRAWVDDRSSVARVLRKQESKNTEDLRR